MPDKEIKSTELAKELKESGIKVKSTDIVRELARMRGVEFKKGTTLIKLSIEEADRIRQIFRHVKVVKPKEKTAPPKEARIEKKVEEKKDEKIEKVKKAEKVEKIEKEKIAEKPEKIER
ncbi:MAG: hypothetical protein QMD44_12530, partial [Thermodesulfovibrionales bacterium]|nr:hypothetical protein [Thermodesulfovibrionales bacterium]